jgi:hypothetical protein
MAKRANAKTVEVNASYVAYMSHRRKQPSSSKRLPPQHTSTGNQ